MTPKEMIKEAYYEGWKECTKYSRRPEGIWWDADKDYAESNARKAAGAWECPECGDPDNVPIDIGQWPEAHCNMCGKRWLVKPTEPGLDEQDRPGGVTLQPGERASFYMAVSPTEPGHGKLNDTKASQEIDVKG